MKTYNEMNTEITNIVTEAIDSAKMEANYYGRVATYQDFLNELDVLLISIKFENVTAKNMFKGLCERKLNIIDPDFKEIVKPSFAMDANGNYTDKKETIILYIRKSKIESFEGKELLKKLIYKFLGI